MRNLIFTVLLAVPAAAFAADGSRRPTFTKDVAPIFYKSCVECHRATMFAPMSLTSFDDARPWARSIKQRVIVADDAAVGRRYAARHVPQRSAAVADRKSRPSSRGLTAARRRATTRICRRCRRSPRAGRSASPTRSSRWTRTSRFRPPARSRISTSGVRPDLTEDKWIQAIEINPSARAQVHHVLAYTQPAGSDRSRAASSGRPTSAA